MRGASGVYIQKHLCFSHTDDLLRLAERAVKEHEKEGCRFNEGWQARLTDRLLAHLPEFIGEVLEGEESFCPERRIGVKEAA